MQQYVQPNPPILNARLLLVLFLVVAALAIVLPRISILSEDNIVPNEEINMVEYGNTGFYFDNSIEDKQFSYLLVEEAQYRKQNGWKTFGVEEVRTTRDCLASKKNGDYLLSVSADTALLVCRVKNGAYGVQIVVHRKDFSDFWSSEMTDINTIALYAAQHGLGLFQYDYSTGKWINYTVTVNP